MVISPDRAPASGPLHSPRHDGLRRSAIEPGGSLTTMVWDGADYLQTRT